MTHKRYGLLALAGSLAILTLWWVRLVAAQCPAECYRSLSAGGWNPLSQPVYRDEQPALKELARLIDRCPASTRFTVYWDSPGTKFGGVRPHVTAFNRLAGTIWDSYELTGETRFHLGGVTVQDVRAVAAKAGGLRELRERVRRRH